MGLATAPHFPDLRNPRSFITLHEACPLLPTFFPHRRSLLRQSFLRSLSAHGSRMSASWLSTTQSQLSSPLDRSSLEQRMASPEPKESTTDDDGTSTSPMVCQASGKMKISWVGIILPYRHDRHSVNHGVDSTDDAILARAIRRCGMVRCSPHKLWLISITVAVLSTTATRNSHFSRLNGQPPCPVTTRFTKGPRLLDSHRPYMHQFDPHA
jgi:hypothetical protein